MKQAIPVLKHVIPNPTFSSGIMFNIEIVKFSGVVLSPIFSQRHPLQVLFMGISGLQEQMWLLSPYLFMVSC